MKGVGPVVKAPGGASHVREEASLVTLCGRVLRGAEECSGEPSCKTCRRTYSYRWAQGFEAARRG